GLGVARADKTLITRQSIGPSGIAAAIAYSGATGAPPAPPTGSLPLQTFGTPTTLNDGCAASPAGSLVGKAVLIRRGTCTFYVKAFNAQAAGASAVVLYNNAAGILSATVTGTPPITIPVVAVDQGDGNAIWAQITSAAGASLTWTNEITSVRNGTGNLISSFSSYGPSPDLDLKPDIGAPGGPIYSTLP